MRELAEEVRDFERWRKRKRLSIVAVARAAAVSRARPAALEQGANWPQWDLLVRLRVVREDFDYG